METKEAIQSAGVALAEYLKTGPTSPSHLEEIREQIYGVSLSLIISPAVATKHYKAICKEFVTQTLKAKGMPTRGVFVSGKQSDLVSSSGNAVARNFDSLRPKINTRYNWCIENYERQATTYLDHQLSQFNDLLLEFLKQVPAGGTKDKGLKSKITEIKGELRYIAKWDQSFYTYKARSLPNELEHLFALENEPLAAIWEYCQTVEHSDDQLTNNHKERDGRVYAVRDNWAIGKGLMQVGRYSYIDEISLPCQEVGCMCSLRYLYNLRSLPEDMLTAEGLSTLKRSSPITLTNSPRVTSATVTWWSGIFNWIMGRRT